MRPSSAVSLTPAMTVRPSSFAISVMRVTVGPSSGSALSTKRLSMAGTVKVAYSGSTTSRAPRSAAWRSRPSMTPRLAVLSPVGAYCATATVSDMSVAPRVLDLAKGGNGGGEAAQHGPVLHDGDDRVGVLLDGELLLGAAPGRQHPRLTGPLGGPDQVAQVCQVLLGHGVGAAVAAQGQVGGADEDPVDHGQGEDGVDVLERGGVLDHRVAPGAGVLLGDPLVGEATVVGGVPAGEGPVTQRGELGVAAHPRGVLGGLDVGDRDGVGTEVECLLDRLALGAEHLGDDLQALGLDEGDEPVQRGEGEGPVLDVEHHRAVPRQPGHLHGSRRGLRQPHGVALVHLTHLVPSLRPVRPRGTAQGRAALRATRYRAHRGVHCVYTGYATSVKAML